jgi:hypothetical protein
MLPGAQKTQFGTISTLTKRTGIAAQIGGSLLA